MQTNFARHGGRALIKALRPVFAKIYAPWAPAVRSNTLQFEVSTLRGRADSDSGPWWATAQARQWFKPAKTRYSLERVVGKVASMEKTWRNAFGGLKACVTLTLQKPSRSPAQLRTIRHLRAGAPSPFPTNCDQKTFYFRHSKTRTYYTHHNTDTYTLRALMCTHSAFK